MRLTSANHKAESSQGLLLCYPCLVRAGASPLAAPPHVSSSHAALLGTQLKARRAAVDSLVTMKAALQAQHFSMGESPLQQPIGVLNRTEC